MAELLTLPGVARKTANIVLGNAYPEAYAADPDSGIAVDTHVNRLSQRLGLAESSDSEKIERELMAIVPRDDWFRLTYLIIEHGRAICTGAARQVRRVPAERHLPVGVQGVSSRPAHEAPTEPTAGRWRSATAARYLPVVALTLLALIWGYNWVVMKVAIRSSDPFTFMTLRTVLGALALFVLVAARRGSLRPKHFWITAIYSIFGTSMTGLTIWALSLGSAGKVSILTYTMPFWLLFIAWPVLAERIQGAQWIAVTVALAGLVCVLEPWNLRGVWASVLATIGGLSWAIASVFFKIIRKRYEVEILSFTAWQALIGSVPLIVVSVIVDDTGPDLERRLHRRAALQRHRGERLRLGAVAVCAAQPAGGHSRRQHAGDPGGGSGVGVDPTRRAPGCLRSAGIGLILLALAILTARELARTRRSRRPDVACPRPVLDPASGATPFLDRSSGRRPLMLGDAGEHPRSARSLREVVDGTSTSVRR